MVHVITDTEETMDKVLPDEDAEEELAEQFGSEIEKTVIFKSRKRKRSRRKRSDG